MKYLHSTYLGANIWCDKAARPRWNASSEDFPTGKFRCNTLDGMPGEWKKEYN